MLARRRRHSSIAPEAAAVRRQPLCVSVMRCLLR
jgi:hypothetical protein